MSDRRVAINAEIIAALLAFHAEVDVNDLVYQWQVEEGVFTGVVLWHPAHDWTSVADGRLVSSPVVEVIRRELMARFSHCPSMEQIADCAYALAEAIGLSRPKNSNHDDVQDAAAGER